MNILLTQASVYLPTLGGAQKENRVMLEALASRGHQCSVVAPACGFQASESVDAFRAGLASRGIAAAQEGDADVFDCDGVRVAAVTDPRRTLARLTREIRDGAPDVVLVASEDPGQTMLETALRASAAPVVYVARTTLALPFGPGTFAESARGVNLIRRTAGTIVVSHFLRQYFRAHAGLEATVLPISLQGPGPFPVCGRYDRGFVMLFNPCAYKGLPILLELARACPDLEFAAVPTWGTTGADRQAIAAVPNIRLLPPCDDVDRLLAEARVLVVPSLWAENKSRSITEAMLRGIPVMASDVGGNAEGLLGLDYLIPVNPITRFHNRVDERMLPVPVVPSQDATPWIAALRQLLASETSYQRLAHASREAAIAANKTVTIDPVDTYLARIADSEPAPQP